MEAIYSNYAPKFLYVDKYHFSSKWVYQDAKTPYSMFRYVYSGRAEFKVDGVSYDVKSDDLFYIPQGSLLYCAAYEELVFVSVRFIGSVQIADEDMLKQMWNFTQCYHLSSQPLVKDLFERIYQSAISRNNYKQLETRGYLNLICADVARMSSANQEIASTDAPQQVETQAMFDINSIIHRAASSHVKRDHRVQSIADYLTMNPQSNLSRDEMCAMCGLSLCTLRRIFKQQTGKTIYEFAKDTRMMYAAHLLVTTQDPISDIGYQLGYESPSYFGKIFHKVFGVSPLEYRRLSEEA